MTTRSVRVLPLVVLSLVAPGCAHAAEDTEAHKVEVEIINERSLPPQRLADALYAKAAMTFEVGPLERAASLNPDDPVYWYRLATWMQVGPDEYWSEEDLEDYAIPSEWDETTASERRNQANAFRERRSLLERALAVTPDYLPALYVYTVTKPSHEQRMQALEHIAKLDRVNAKPYYIMALLQAQEVTRGKQFGKKWLVKEQACLLTNSEWQPVLDSIRKGNKRPAFSATSARLPILSDVRASVNGKPCPDSSVQSYLGSWLNNLGGLAEWPGSFTAAARARQLARQTHWQARQSKKHGKDSEAREMVQALQSFADRYATSKPRRITSFMVGAGIKAIAFHAESEILTAPANGEERRRAEQQSKDWRKIATDIAEESLRSLQEDGKALRSSGCGLDYPDFAAEEARVNALIKKMGLDTKG